MCHAKQGLPATYNSPFTICAKKIHAEIFAKIDSSTSSNNAEDELKEEEGNNAEEDGIWVLQSLNLLLKVLSKKSWSYQLTRFSTKRGKTLVLKMES